MLIKLFQWMLSLALLAAVAAILIISSGYIILKPNLPEINLVNENALQVPLKIFTEDGVLIGEFGEQKRSRFGTGSYKTLVIQVMVRKDPSGFYESNLKKSWYQSYIAHRAKSVLESYQLLFHESPIWDGSSYCHERGQNNRASPWAEKSLVVRLQGITDRVVERR